MATRNVLGIGVANAPGPMLHLFRVATTWWAIIDRGLGHAATAAARRGVEHTLALAVFLDADLGTFAGRGEEHHFLFTLQDDCAVSSHDHFAVIAEAVAVDRRVSDHDFL